MIPSTTSKTTPASATAGKKIKSFSLGTGAIVRRLLGSVAGKLALLLIIFIVFPAILYAEFSAANKERNNILLRSVQEQGRLIAQSLAPLLITFDGKVIQEIRASLERLAGGRLNVKLLFLPEGDPPTGDIYYVAVVPPLAAEYLDEERGELIQTGIFDRLHETCEGIRPFVQRYTNPTGKEEILSSVTPFHTDAGCWAIITSHAPTDVLGASLGQPYWKKPEARLAGAIYALMAILVISLFLGVWRSLNRFGKLARAIRREGTRKGSFAEFNRVPELHEVAEEFDQLVNTLQGSAQAIRTAAEENAHALKTPIAVISQSLEPLKRTVSPDDARGRRALQLVEQSVEKLDALVSAARRMDEQLAELIDPPREIIDLSSLLGRIIATYSEAPAARKCRFVSRIEEGLAVRASEEMLETIVENVIENAISFSPQGGAITVSLHKEGAMAMLTVEDEGPGVDGRHLERIFHRYFSVRPRTSGRAGHAERGQSDGGMHFGIGLWVVRRNTESIGGSVGAENRSVRGLKLTLRFPLA